MKRPIALIFAAMAGLPGSAPGARSLPLERIRLPPGYEISVFSTEVPGLSRC